MKFFPSWYGRLTFCMQRIREVLVKGNSVSLRLSASTDDLIKGKVEESHFAVEMKSAVFGQIRKMDFPSFPLSRDSFHV